MEHEPYENQNSQEPDPEENIFDGLAVTPESVDKFLNDRDRYDTSKHVCICGHAINKHTTINEYVTCHTARHYCPCQRIKPVLYANDTRYFMRKTYGPGSKHALSTGLKRLVELGKGARWLEPPQCWNPNCANPHTLVYPVAISNLGNISNEPEKINVFLCEVCFMAFLGKPGEPNLGHVC
jgi:hypothetical protein